MDGLKVFHEEKSAMNHITLFNNFFKQAFLIHEYLTTKVFENVYLQALG